MRKKLLKKLREGKIALDLESANSTYICTLLNSIFNPYLHFYPHYLNNQVVYFDRDRPQYGFKSSIDDDGFVKGTNIKYLPYKDFLTPKEKVQLVYEGEATIRFPVSQNRQRDLERLVSTFPKSHRTFDLDTMGNYYWASQFSGKITLTTKQPENLIVLSTDGIISKQRRNFEAVRRGEMNLRLPKTLRALKAAKDIVFDIFPQAKDDLEGFFDKDRFKGNFVVANGIDFKFKGRVKGVPTVTVFDVVENHLQDDEFKCVFGNGGREITHVWVDEADEVIHENLKKQVEQKDKLLTEAIERNKNLNKSWAAQSNEVANLKRRITKQAAALKEYERIIE